MKSLLLCAFLLVAFASDVLTNINPYIPVLVVPKSPIIKCPVSCSSARDCFFVHPLSDQHFYSCFHGKAMVHQCPTGKSFSDDKHQCVMKGSGGEGAADLTGLSSAKIDELTEKINAFEQLVDKFQLKMEKVQKVIIESDNKIGLLGKFLLKALKSNRETYCAKGATASADGKLGANGQQSNAASSEIKPQELMIDDSMLNGGGGRGDEEYGISIGGMQTPKSSSQVGASGLHQQLHQQAQHDHSLVDEGAAGSEVGGAVFGPKTGADDDEVEMPAVVGGQKQPQQQQDQQQSAEAAIEEAKKENGDEQKSGGAAEEQQAKTT